MTNPKLGDRVLDPAAGTGGFLSAAIVERVEALMATRHELEAEITASKTQAEQLLQAVLKEAFSN